MPLDLRFINVECVRSNVREDRLGSTQRERNPAGGFAGDFVDVVRSLAPYWASGGRCRLISNAGGLNPRGCAEACKKALDEAGMTPQAAQCLASLALVYACRGKFEHAEGALRNAIRIFEAALPCFASGSLPGPLVLRFCGGIGGIFVMILPFRISNTP